MKKAPPQDSIKRAAQQTADLIIDKLAIFPQKSSNRSYRADLIKRMHKLWLLVNKAFSDLWRKS